MRKYRIQSIILCSLLLLGLSTPLFAFTYYMPEGYVADGVDEFVAILNSSDKTAKGEVKIYYEDGTKSSFPVQFLPKQRSGVTLKDNGVKLNKAFSTLIDTDQDITATLIHYDHGTALGANFTKVKDSMWSIAGGGPASNTRDYLSIFNPNDFKVDVELSVAGRYPLPKKFKFTIEKERRYSFAVHEFLTDENVRNKIYGLMLFAKKSSNTSQSADIVVALSHYDDSLKDGILTIATPGADTTLDSSLHTYGHPTGFVAEGWANDQAFEYVNILNPNQTFPIKLKLTVQYNDGITETQEVNYINSNERVAYKISDHVRKNKGYMLKYEAVSSYSSWPKPCVPGKTPPCNGDPVNAVVNFSHFDNSGLNGVEFKSKGSKKWEIAEGYRKPGQVREYLLIYNPSGTDANVKVTFTYDDAQLPTVVNLLVEAGKKNGLALHEKNPPLRDRDGGIWYGINIDSDVEIIPYFTHYDLNFGGSFALAGSEK